MILIAIGVWGVLAVVAAVTMFRARWWGLIAAAFAAVVGVACVLWLPVDGELVEMAIVLTAMGAFLLVLLLMILHWRGDRPNWADADNICRYAATAIMLVVTFVAVMRSVQVEMLRQAFAGNVTKVYRSSNHQSPAIEVLDVYRHVKIENIDQALFDRIVVGDRLEKEALHEHGRLNGEVVRVVRGSRFWRGKDVE